MVRGEEGPDDPGGDATLRPEVDTGETDDTDDGRATPRAPGVPGHDVESLVGRGGFATVWRAHQRSVGRTVAVKVLDQRVLDDEVMARFRFEVATLAELSWNPHTVHVYDVGRTDDGRPYVSMEWMAGGSLAERIDDSGPLPPDEVVRVGLALSDAVDAAHHAGVLHRDVKPENVLVNHRGDAKLADFGVARLAEATTSIAHGAFRGTVLHAAPELLDGAEPSPASDVWGIGSTLFLLCTGRAPFSRTDGSPDSVTGIIRRTLLEPTPALPDGVPPDLAAVVLDCLAKDPAERPADARVVHDRLAAVRTPTLGEATGAAATGAPAAPAAATTGGRAERAGTRRRLTSAAAALALVAMVGVVAALVAGGDDDPARVAAATTVATAGEKPGDDPVPGAAATEAEGGAGDGPEGRLPEDQRMPPLPTRAGVSGLSPRHDAEDASPAMHAALDRFAATTALPAVAGAVGAVDIDPETLDFTEVPAVFDYVASNANSTASCRRVLLPELQLDGVAARIWSDGEQIVLVNMTRLGTELDARRYYVAGALNFGLDRDHCDGWPADGVATHLDIERLRVDRTDVRIAPAIAPDRAVTSVTRDAMLGAVEVDRSYQLLAQYDDLVVIAMVGSVGDGTSTSPENLTQLVDDLAAALLS